MLYYAAVFFVIALIAAVFGFGGIAAGAVEVARILFVVFLIGFVTPVTAFFIHAPALTNKHAFEYPRKAGSKP